MNVNATRKWLIAFMLCVFIVRVTKTLKQPLSSLSSSPMKKKKTIQTTKRKTNTNTNTFKKGVATKTKSHTDFSSIETHALETTEEIRARVKVNALGLGETSYASNMIASNVTWFDRAYVKEKLDYERFVKCSSSSSSAGDEGVILPDVTDVENVTPDRMKRKVTLSWMPTDEMRGLDVEMKMALGENNGGMEEEDENASDEQQQQQVLTEEERKKKVQQRRVAKLAKAAAVEATTRAENDPRGLSTNWGRCAAVGNSGYGKAIDSHDVVVRINQAPIRGYSRRVGLKVTHRVFNRLWTRAYYLSPSKLKRTNKEKEEELKKMKSRDPSKARHAMRQFKSSSFKGKTPWENNALEDNVAIIITRASLKEFGLLANQFKKYRPDVLPIRLSSKATTMSSKPLMAYREKLCKSGFGPYRGLNVPSSGFVAAYAMLSSDLCKSLDVYGFGVEGMAQASKGLQTRAGEVLDRTKVQELTNSNKNVTMSYHYFKGLGARTEGNDVHSFDTEEKAFEAYGRGNFFDNPNSERNWNCGCRFADVNECKPYSIGGDDKSDGSYDYDLGTTADLDCRKGVDCTAAEKELLRGEFERNQKLPSADDDDSVNDDDDDDDDANS
ncbi:unnamed protein product [Bathycoccus prasinos]